MVNPLGVAAVPIKFFLGVLEDPIGRRVAEAEFIVHIGRGRRSTKTYAKIRCLGGMEGDSEMWGRRVQQLRSSAKLLGEGLTNQAGVAESA